MKLGCLLGVLLAFGPCAAGAQPAATQPRPARQLQWTGIFGKDSADEHRDFVLMSRGWLGLPGLSVSHATPELEQYLGDWLKAHPEAQVIPVEATLFSEDESFTSVYCWLSDGKDNLNVELVRQGLCTAEDMSVDEYSERLVAARDEIQRFAQAIAKAEMAAIGEKRGRWVQADEREATWCRANDLEQAGDFRAAAQEFERAAVKPSKGELSAGTPWLRAARCHDKVGAYESALAAFDKAIANDATDRWYYEERAQCMARHGEAEKAAALFRKLVEESPDDLELRRAFAAFQRSQKEFKSAAALLEEGVQAFLKKSDLQFDRDYRIVWDEARVQKAVRSPTPDAWWSAVSRLPFLLGELGGYCLDAGQDQKALQYATMGLSASQRLGGLKAEDTGIAEAGDVACRYVRARVCILRRSFDEAKAEIDQAKVLIDAGYLQGPFVNAELKQMYDELRTRFPDRKLTIPERRKPASRPAPINTATASEDELVRLAAADDPSNSYLALMELVQRTMARKLSPETMKRVIDDGLKRQADPNVMWRDLYGSLIAMAWKRDELTAAQIDQCVRHILPAPELSCGYAAYGDDRVWASIELSPRFGRMPDSPYGMETGVFAIIRPVEGRIDGRAVSIVDHAAGPVPVWIVPLGIGRPGFGFGFRETQKLKPGDHKLSLRCHIQIKRGNPRYGLEAEEANAASALLAEWPLDLACDFDVREPAKADH